MTRRPVFDRETSSDGPTAHCFLFGTLQDVTIQKTEEMVFDPGHVGDNSPLLIHDVNIAQVDSYKYLVVHMNSNLSWNVHVLGSSSDFTFCVGPGCLVS